MLERIMFKITQEYVFLRQDLWAALASESSSPLWLTRARKVINRWHQRKNVLPID